MNTYYIIIQKKIYSECEERIIPLYKGRRKRIIIMLLLL